MKKKVESKIIICRTKIQIFIFPVRIDSTMDRFHKRQLEKKVSDCLQYIIFIDFYLPLFVFKVLFLFMHYYLRVAEEERAFQEEDEDQAQREEITNNESLVKTK